MKRYTDDMQPKFNKKDIVQNNHPTRAPRLEGTVKEARMQPVRKSKKTTNTASSVRKPQGPSEQQRKDYQLKSKRH